MNLLKKDRKYLGRDVPASDFSEITGAFGNYLIDARGNKYLDFLMGWCVGNFGWNVPEIRKEYVNFKGPAYVNPNYLYEPWGRLAELLAKITPGNLEKSFRATGGTEAVEIAMQAAMCYTGRHKFISIEGAYHGHSIGAMSIGDSLFRKKYKNLLPGCYKISPPLDEKAAEKIEKILGTGKVAAFISEPIICNLGVEIPDKQFFKRVAQACRQYGSLLIMDEVATGFGRTGVTFASSHYDLKPDIMCLGKALSGGYGAIGATIMTTKVARSMEWDFSVYSTFGWHPLNTQATIANIEYFLKHKKAILSNANKISRYFEQRLKQMKFKYPAEINIKGLAIGIKFKQRGYALELVKKCIKNGLLFSELGPHIITLFPALTIDKKTAKKGLDILESCL